MRGFCKERFVLKIVPNMEKRSKDKTLEDSELKYNSLSP
jgi:hypothetical protein